jgi:hypothetical protein
MCTVDCDSGGDKQLACFARPLCYFARYYVNSSWMDTFTRVATGSAASPVRYSDSPDIARWNASSLVCARRVVAMGAAGYVVSGSYGVHSHFCTLDVIEHFKYRDPWHVCWR